MGDTTRVIEPNLQAKLNRLIGDNTFGAERTVIAILLHEEDLNYLRDVFASEKLPLASPKWVTWQDIPMYVHPLAERGKPLAAVMARERRNG